jgi:hypothetical protein
MIALEVEPRVSLVAEIFTGSRYHIRHDRPYTSVAHTS